MNRREFIQKTAGLLSTLTLFSSTSRTRARGLEERILWEEAQRRIRRNPKVNYAFFPQYAPAQEGFPPLFAAGVPPVALFFPYPERGSTLLYPLAASLYIIMPPGYEGERVEYSPFQQGTQDSPVPLGELVWKTGDVSPLQPVPNIFSHWNGFFVRKGMLGGEEYLFVMGRENQPPFLVERGDREIHISFFEFSSRGLFEQGSIAVYRNGEKDEDLSGLFKGRGEEKDHIHIRRIVRNFYIDERRGVYPLYQGETSVYHVTLTIPLARARERLTLAYAPRTLSDLPARLTDVHLEDELKHLSQQKWYHVYPPLLLHLYPDRLEERILIIPKTRTIVYVNKEADTPWLKRWLPLAFKQLRLKERMVTDVYRVIAFPALTSGKGFRLRAADEPDQLWE